MDPTWGLLLLFILFLLGIPVTYALGFTAIFIMHFSTGMKWMVIGQEMIHGLNSFTILAVPLFLFAGKIMNACGITDRLFTSARALVGWAHGGLGHVNVLASFIFAGMSGTAIADATGLGLIEIDAMEKAGYDKDFAASVTAASSTLGPIVPPSMPLVVYGTISGASIGALFMAEVLPGIVMGLLMCTVVFIYAKKNSYPRDKFPNAKLLWKALGAGFLPCMSPVIILLGIYTGLFTPTESAAVVVIYAAILGFFVYKEIHLKGLIKLVAETVKDAIGICILISTATLFGNTLVKAIIPQTIVANVVSVIDNKYIFLIVLNLVLLVVGMFMETVSSITILTPILFPIVMAFGISPIHFGIIMVLNLMIGVVSPPFGIVLFAINKVGNIPYGRLVRALLPWYVCLLVALIVITFIPAISTWLPSMMKLTV